jgi:hypothetical protein
MSLASASSTSSNTSTPSTGRAPAMTDIGKFYKQIEDFKGKLVIIFEQFGKSQEIVNLNKYYDKLVLFKKANVRKPIELFYTHVVIPYCENILTRDEKFFIGQISHVENKGLETGVTYKLDGSTETFDQRDLFFVSQIRQIWERLPTNVCDNIWAYVQVICLLSERVVNGQVLAQTRQRLKDQGLIE